MSNLKILIDIQNIIFSAKIELLFQNNKELIREDLTNNIVNKYKKKQYIYIETKEYVYKLMNNSLLNIITKKDYSDEEILLKLTNGTFKISKNVSKKFNRISDRKLKEVIKLFSNKCTIIKKSAEHIYIKSNLHDSIISFDYHNNYVEKIYMSKNKKEWDFYTIKKDKITMTNNTQQKEPDINNFIEQLFYLESYCYNIKKYRQDISQNHKEIEKKDNKIFVSTNNYIYTIENYNIIDISDRSNIKYPKAAYVNLRKENVLDIFYNYKTDPKYITLQTVQSLYRDFKKAQEYIYKLGLSVRVITRFNTDNNFRELIDFLVADIVNYGIIQYDNFDKGDMIISTNRFFYLIKEGVILNILNKNKEDIPECSLIFKPTLEYTEKKNSILELEINDAIRDYIPFNEILALKPGNHVIDRFTERIAKNNDVFYWGEDIKKDIYTFGTVMLGTYYQETQLIRGRKYVYVISERRIISIWQPNEFIDYLNKKLFQTVNNIPNENTLLEEYATVIA